MPAPPGVVIAHPVTPGGFKNTGSTEDMVRAAHLIFANCGVETGGSKVSRLVRDFRRRVEQNGFAFFDFLANSVQLDAECRRTALSDPDVLRVIAYSDPTGEAAIRNVMKASRS